MTRFQSSLLPGLAAIALTLAGCGQANLPFATSANALATDDAAASAAAKPHGPRGHQGGPRGGFGEKGMGMLPGLPGMMGAALSLTDEQKTQLQAIAETYKPQPPAAPAAGQEAHKALADVLLAATVDDAALRAALAAVEAAKPAQAPPSHTAMLMEVRAVLTEAQRQAIVDRLKAEGDKPEPTDRPAPPAGAPDRGAGFAAKLQLNDEQKAALDALQAAFKPSGEAPDRAAGKAALIAFWSTGDASGLEALMPAPRAFPTEAFIKVAELLDQTQRQALFGRGGLPFGGPGPEGPMRGGHERGGAPGAARPF